MTDEEVIQATWDRFLYSRTWPQRGGAELKEFEIHEPTLTALLPYPEGEPPSEVIVRRIVFRREIVRWASGKPAWHIVYGRMGDTEIEVK